MGGIVLETNVELQRKIDKVLNALEDFEEGKPLPISIHDIQFLVGACQSLLKQIRKVNSAYKTDFIKLNEDVDKWKQEYKRARQMVCRHDETIMKYKQVIRQVKLLPNWRQSKGLRKELESLAELEKNRPALENSEKTP